MPKDKSISRRELLTITSVTAAYALMSKTALGKEPKTVETIQDVIRSQLPGASWRSEFDLGERFTR